MALDHEQAADLRPPTMVDETTGDAVTMIACYMCRKRKIKCNRIYPECSNCTQTQQTCTYPTRVTRPGPKIGSTQNSRKRTSEVLQDAEPAKRATVVSVTAAPSSVSSNVQQLPQPSVCPNIVQQPLSPSASTHSTTASHPSRDITSLSFILHPSLEPREHDPQSDAVVDMDSTRDNDSVITSACCVLGVGVTEMNQLYVLKPQPRLTYAPFYSSFSLFTYFI